jgi:hypothetical protein
MVTAAIYTRKLDEAIKENRRLVERSESLLRQVLDLERRNQVLEDQIARSNDPNTITTPHREKWARRTRQ